MLTSTLLTLMMINLTSPTRARTVLAASVRTSTSGWPFKTAAAPYDFWRVNLKPGDRLQVDFGALNQDGVVLCLLRPNVTDYNRTQSDCVLERSTTGKYEFVFTATVPGAWTLQFGACGAGYNECDYDVAYEMTTTVPGLYPPHPRGAYDGSCWRIRHAEGSARRCGERQRPAPNSPARAMAASRDRPGRRKRLVLVSSKVPLSRPLRRARVLRRR